MRATRPWVAASVVLAGLLAGCGDDGGVEAAEPSRSSPATTSEAVGADAPGTPTASPGGDTAPPPSPEAAPPSTTSSPPPAAGTRPPDEQPQGEGPGAGLPPETLPVHGARVWAVYLAVGDPSSDWEMHSLGEAESFLRFTGYVGSGIGSVGCDLGAAESLGFDPDDNRLAVYFESAADAQLFQGGYERQDLGSAQVTTYCLD